MNVKINLLPPDLAFGKGFARVSGFVRKLNLFLFSFFAVFYLAIAIILVVFWIQLRNLDRREALLKAQIAGLEAAETNIVFLKDRIGKIVTARRSENAQPVLEAVFPLLAQIGGDSAVTELNLDFHQKIELSVNFGSLASLSEFLKHLETAGSLDTVILTSFGFNPETGYLLNLKLTPKS